MALTSHRQHKIYLAAIMDFGIASNNPEEIAYFNEIQAEVKKNKKSINIGIPRKD